MKRLVPITLVFVYFLAPLMVAAQTPTGMRVVAVGEIDSPTLRKMTGEMCGPFFTLVPLDSHGGGVLNLVVDAPEGRGLVRFLVKAINVTLCDSCDVPLFKQSGDESNVRGDLKISTDHLKLSPCLKSAKLSKR
jgi:DNA-directed RNA polymerase alpha subunit